MMVGESRPPLLGDWCGSGMVSKSKVKLQGTLPVKCSREPVPLGLSGVSSLADRGSFRLTSTLGGAVLQGKRPAGLRDGFRTMGRRLMGRGEWVGIISGITFRSQGRRKT